MNGYEQLYGLFPKISIEMQAVKLLTKVFCSKFKFKIQRYLRDVSDDPIFHVSSKQSLLRWHILVLRFLDCGFRTLFFCRYGTCLGWNFRNVRTSTDFQSVLLTYHQKMFDISFEA